MTPLWLHLLAMKREFKFVPYGSVAPSDGDRPTISCDGRIDGATLELTHWNGNTTPDKYYADTSTEMALNFAKQEYQDAWIMNNHYDTDGVLSVWACLHPEKALPYKKLLIAGAEAGDFGEWSSDEGVKLDCALGSIRAACRNDEEAFYDAFQQLPDLLEDLQGNQGMKFAQLWNKEGQWDKIVETYERYASWNLALYFDSFFNERLAMVHTERSSDFPLNCYVLHRALQEQGLAASTTRILHTDGQNYYYQMAGHGWVNRLIQRPVVPAVDKKMLANELNRRGSGGTWIPSSSGLVSLIETEFSSFLEEIKLLSALSKIDPAFQT